MAAHIFSFHITRYGTNPVSTRPWNNTFTFQSQFSLPSMRCPDHCHQHSHHSHFMDAFPSNLHMKVWCRTDRTDLGDDVHLDVKGVSDLLRSRAGPPFTLRPPIMWTLHLQLLFFTYTASGTCLRCGVAAHFRVFLLPLPYMSSHILVINLTYLRRFTQTTQKLLRCPRYD